MRRVSGSWVLPFALMGLLAGACGESTTAGGSADALDTVTAADTLTSDGVTDIGETPPPDVATPVDVATDTGQSVSCDDPSSGGFGCPCASNDECQSEYCYTTKSGSFCTKVCQDECPKGWQCKSVSNGPDIIWLCAPKEDILCEPCATDKECGGPGDLCVPVGDPGDTYCTLLCVGDLDCPVGYHCGEATGDNGATASQCLPDTGSCVCTAELDGTKKACSVANDVGTCYGEQTCDGPAGWSDCDAKEPAEEVCDGFDNDCNGQSDDGLPPHACTVDNDQGSCAGTETCTGDLGWICDAATPEADICDGEDNDCDGEVDEDFPLEGQPCDGDDADLCPGGEWVCAESGLGLDCVGDDAVIELCDGVDNDCDGEVDEGFPGLSDACDTDDPDLCAGGVLICSADGSGLVCDGDVNVAESCDGLDDDCDGAVDEGFVDTDQDTLADCVDPDDDGDGDPDETDCAPLDPAIYAGAEEGCNAIDDDCDGETDEDFPDTDGDHVADCLDDDDDDDGVKDPNDNCPLVYNLAQKDTDQDGQGDACDEDDDDDTILDVDDNCPLVWNVAQKNSDDDPFGDACDDDDDEDGDPDVLDCAPTNPDVHHGAIEVCDGLDNDCDVMVDEGFPDFDKDGEADCVDGDDDNDGDPDETDCEPKNAAVFTGAFELCNLKDDDCDGAVDEGYPDKDGNGVADCQDDDIDGDGDPNVTDCAPEDPAIFHNATEACDGIDNNCVGGVDEGFPDTDKDGVKDCVDDDDDNDGVLDPEDNCPLVANPPQKDQDSDLVGDLCDDDIDGDGDPNDTDCQPKDPAIFTGAPESCNGKDDDCDALIDEEDATGCVQMFFDGDNDGFGNSSSTKCLCAAQGKWAALVGSDCNDANVAVFPGAAEVCNGIDDDCDGEVDQQDASGCKAFYEDLDVDGFGAGDALCLCKGAGTHTAGKAGDCNDGDAAVNPGAAEQCNGKDDDCDGEVDEQGAGGCKIYYTDEDTDGYGVAGTGICLCGPEGLSTATQAGDCNDDDALTHGGAPELCNGQDDDCDGLVDEDGAADPACVTFYKDGDGDKYGDDAQKKCLCKADGAFNATSSGDCNDADPAVHPGAVEICKNGKDDDCDGVQDTEGAQGCQSFLKDADEDAYGVTGDGKCLCSATAPYTAKLGGDCDDTNAAVSPVGKESCNGLDDDCDGVVDNESALGCDKYYLDTDQDGYGANSPPKCLCAPGAEYSAVLPGDCNDGDPEVFPAHPEACDGKDNNCNGSVDEGVTTTYFLDQDKDGYGTATAQKVACAAPAGYVEAGGDCNDFNGAINPGAAEICNDLDDNCNGSVDEPDPSNPSDPNKKVTIYKDLDGDGHGAMQAAGEQKCLYDTNGDGTGETPPSGYALDKTDCNDSNATVFPGADELCDGILNNCDLAVADATCPVKCAGAWPFAVGGSSGYPVIAQLDSDNELEVLSQNEGKVRVLEHNGALKWEVPLAVSYSYPSVADMNGDNTLDVIVSTHSGGGVKILNGTDGALLATIPVPSSAGHYGTSVFDVDGDGALDLVASGSKPYHLVLLNPDLTVKKDVSLAPASDEIFGLTMPLLADFDGDGVSEIVLGSGNWGCQSNPDTCKGRVYVFNSAGGTWNDPTWTDPAKPWFQVTGYPQVYAGEGRWPLLADADGDGVSDLWYTFSGSPSNLWTKDGAEHALSGKGGGTFPVVAPIAADGTMDPTGALLAQGGPVADIDGDGVYEIIRNQGGGIAVVKGGAVVPGYPLDLGGVPVISDIDRDGKMDILFLSGANNALNCYTLGSGTFEPTRILSYGTVDGVGRGHYQTLNHDPFEPNDNRNTPFVPELSTNPVKDSRAFRMGAFRDTFSSGGGWVRRLRALIGEAGDRDFYLMKGGIINVSLSGLERDYDLYLHMYRPDGTYIDTWTSAGTGKSESINCHSTTGCPESGTSKTFIIEVRGKDEAKDFGPVPYILTTSWAN